MNKFKHFLGIDVSKEYFDAVLILNGAKEKPIHKVSAILALILKM